MRKSIKHEGRTVTGGTKADQAALLAECTEAFYDGLRPMPKESSETAAAAGPDAVAPVDSTSPTKEA
jgi:hypothetical protein